MLFCTVQRTTAPAIAYGAVLVLLVSLVACQADKGGSGSSGEEGERLPSIGLGITTGDLSGGPPGGGTPPLVCLFTRPDGSCVDRYSFTASTSGFHTFELDTFGTGSRDNNLDLNLCDPDVACSTNEGALSTSGRFLSPYEATTYFLAAGESIVVQVTSNGTLASRSYRLIASLAAALPSSPHAGSVEAGGVEGEGIFVHYFLITAGAEGKYDVAVEGALAGDFDIFLNIVNDANEPPKSASCTRVTAERCTATVNMLGAETMLAEVEGLKRELDPGSTAISYPYTLTFDFVPPPPP